LQRIERRIARAVVLVRGEKGEDFNLLVKGQGKRSFGAFAPDTFRGFALAQGIDQASRNGSSLKENFSSGRRASGEAI
jgi:hypothetical protein